MAESNQCDQSHLRRIVGRWFANLCPQDELHDSLSRITIMREISIEPCEIAICLDS